MDFAYTPEQEALQEEVRQFIADNITPDVSFQALRKLRSSCGLCERRSKSRR